MITKLCHVTNHHRFDQDASWTPHGEVILGIFDCEETEADPEHNGEITHLAWDSSGCPPTGRAGGHGWVACYHTIPNPNKHQKLTDQGMNYLISAFFLD